MRFERGHHHQIKVHQEERHWGLAAAIAIAVIGAGVGTYAAVQSSEQQAAMAKAIQKQKDLEAQQASETAQFEEVQARRRLRMLAGRLEAEQAASGIDISQGTPLIQELDLAKQSELEALSIRRAGAQAASGSEFESSIARYQGRVARAQIPLEIGSGVLQAAAGATRAYTIYKHPYITRSIYSDYL